MMLVCDEYEAAFLGFTEDVVSGTTRAVYSIPKCIDALVEDGMTLEEASEYFAFNTLGAYVGPGTPVFISPTSFETAKSFLESAAELNETDKDLH